MPRELLTDSSDERSEYWTVSTRSARKTRGRRRQACPGLLRACNAFLVCTSVLATATLIWLFIDVRQQLTALRTELDQVIAGSEGVPDALQKCHSLSRDLQNNQTIIFSHLSDLKLQMNNFTAQLSGMQHGLRQVQETLQDSPELASVPKGLNELSNTVARFGSQIQDLGVTIATLKRTNAKLQDAQTTMRQNITDLKHSLDDISERFQSPQALATNGTEIKTEELNATIARLTSDLNRVNETLSTKLQLSDDDRKSLAELQNLTQSMSTKVTSLEGECAKATEQAVISELVNKLKDQLAEIRAMDLEVNGKLKQLEQSYNALRNSSAPLTSTGIKNKQQGVKSKEEGTSSRGQTSPESTTATGRGVLGSNEESRNMSSTTKPNH
ncbi:structural maintenance of chromosomes protein 4 isoform X3 [Orussus abietinus]|uniref:structural maintenance of chromosomes protein 4 isoform X3 n=1 Tax=Orussus abietinus TaxID=222816 RepID=UPI000626EAC6|nr:structural maintenance of chromosomes protein 4 isoform X3 [Orussus abietinus]